MIIIREPKICMGVSFCTAQGTLPNEDLREGELRRTDARARGWLRQHDGAFPHVRLPVLPRDGRPLADVWAAELQRPDAVRQAWRVQGSPRPGNEQPVQNQLHQTHNRFLLKLRNGKIKKVELQHFWSLSLIPSSKEQKKKIANLSKFPCGSHNLALVQNCGSK